MNETLDPRVKERLNRYEWAAAIYKEMKAELGEERAMAVANRALAKVQERAAAEVARQMGDNSFAAWTQHWRQQVETRGGVEVVEATPTRLALRTTRCYALEALRILGVPELIHAWCKSDYPGAPAFNPRMRMERTKTIADGDGYCDHTYFWEEE